MEEDEHDRKKEKDELETLRLEVMERQIREMEEEQERKKQEEIRQQDQNKDDNTDAMADIEDDIPISKQEGQLLSSIKVTYSCTATFTTCTCTCIFSNKRLVIYLFQCHETPVVFGHLLPCFLFQLLLI